MTDLETRARELLNRLEYASLDGDMVVLAEAFRSEQRRALEGMREWVEERVREFNKQESLYRGKPGAKGYSQLRSIRCARYEAEQITSELQRRLANV